LAAVLVVVTIAPWLLTVGMNAFVARETARHTDRGRLLGTVATLSLGTAVLGLVCAYPVAHLVGHGRRVVESLILVGFALLPLNVVGTGLLGVLWDEAHWRRLSAVRLLSAGLVAVGFVVLAATHQFTVTTAASVTFAAGIVSFAPLCLMLRRARGWHFDRELARGAVSYGTRAWLGDAANLSNLRLDQLLMAGLVPAKELGLYAVAVTLAGLTGIFSQALNILILPFVAGGAGSTVRRILRITLFGTAGMSAIIGLAAPRLISVLFGHAFAASAGLAQVLLVGAVLLAGTGVLNAALNGAGHPGDTALAQGLGCAATVPALIVVLPSAGAMGAALVSVASYGIVFVVLLCRTRRHLGGLSSEYLIPTAADLVDLRRYAKNWFAVAVASGTDTSDRAALDSPSGSAVPTSPE
jgi:O-antigen/teichoic acid export membrane protein